LDRPDSINASGNWTLIGDHLVNANTGGVGIGSEPLQNFSVSMNGISEQVVQQNARGGNFTTVEDAGAWQSFTLEHDVDVNFIVLSHANSTTKGIAIYEGVGTSGNLLYYAGSRVFMMIIQLL